MEDQTEDEEMPMSNDETPSNELDPENLLDEKIVEPQQQETEPESEILFETETTENGTQQKDEPTVDETEMSENNVQQDNDEPTLKETEAAENETQQDEEPTVKLTNLPIARIRKIIKTDPEISLVNQEAVFLITKATELFIDCMTKESYKYTYQSKKKTIQKHDVQSAIDNVDALVFLDGV